MRRSPRAALKSLIVAIGFTGMVVPGWAGHVRADDGQEVTVQGEIVDMACFMSKGSRGASHKACAQMCAKKGVPLGVLTDAGDVFLLLDDHNNSDPYEAAKKLAGERAEVRGKQFSKPGVTSILVGGVKGL